MRKLGRILLLAMMAVGSMAGMKMSQEEIEKLMNLMNRTEIVQMIEKDDPPR